MKNEYDYIIIGSGFGGSTSALRLTEKGYTVAILEKGREFNDSDFPKSTWNIRKFLWAPLLKCFGILKITWFKDVMIVSGTGVGGGSLVYANTLLMPPDEFFRNPVWKDIKDWKTTLAPFYKTAKHMLGVVENPWNHKADDILRDVARDMGKEDTVQNVQVGVYFNDSKEAVDPYFNGHGPLRVGCDLCAGCMVGCRKNAKNTLVKNYLYFARKFGAKVFSKTYVEKIEFINDKYHVHTYKTGSWFKSKRRTFISTGIVFSGGVLGSVELLLKQKYKFKTLTMISKTLGQNVRTNSEMLCAVTSDSIKLNEGVAISSVMNPDPDTHVEIVKYPDGSGLIKFLTLPYTDFVKGPRRIVNSLLELLRHPIQFFKLYFGPGWASRTIIFLVMQHLDSSMKMGLSKIPFFGVSLKNSTEDEIPIYVESGVDVMKRYGEKVAGVLQASSSEIILKTSSTAHILGGIPMGESAESGVVDDFFRVHNYPNMYVLDGSIVQCNIGVNPSLTITGLTEYAMSHIKSKKGSKQVSLDELIKTPGENY